MTVAACVVAYAFAFPATGGAGALPHPYCADRSAVFSGPQRFIGMMDNAAIANPGYFDCTLGILAHDGIGYYRTPIIWQYVEGTRGAIDFSLYDPLMRLMAIHHVKWLPILLGAPSFDSLAPKHGALPGYYAPHNAADFARFASAAVRRYGPRGTFWQQDPGIPKDPITAWQIWNEPNLPAYWRPRPSAAAYTRMLRSVAKAIRRADRGAEIVTAGLAFSSLGVPVPTYYSEMFRDGARGSFNTLGLNLYAPTVKLAIARAREIRALMNDHRDGRAGIWISEFGWSSGGPAGPYRAAGPRDQARRTSQLLDWMIANRRTLRIQSATYTLWRNERPATPSQDYWGLHMGALTVAGKPLPVLGVLAAAARRTDR